MFIEMGRPRKLKNFTSNNICRNNCTSLYITLYIDIVLSSYCIAVAGYFKDSFIENFSDINFVRIL